jgi:predicted alpha/beta-fold hydrolase
MKLTLDGAVVDFRPLPLLEGPHVQTILASLMAVSREPPSVLRRLELPGGDRLALHVSTPRSWRPENPTVALVHGLCGCARSTYIVRLARKLLRCGTRAVRVDLRGCGAGRGLAREPYHSGRSEDLLAVARALREESPRSPLSLVGYSLGGNMTLKLAGELGSDGRELLRSVAAVSPPVDLLASSNAVSLPKNRIYQRTFLKLLRRDLERRRADFPDETTIDLPEKLTMREFDELFTAPRCGFRDALDYYLRTSALPLLPSIAIPALILAAEDDPLVDSRALFAASLPPNVEVRRTRRGGHLGFLGFPGAPGGCRWMDHQLLDWIGRV